MTRFDSFYKSYQFSYGSPIMGKFLKRKCYFCKRDLRKVPKDTIVMGEVEWGYEEPLHTERHYWCNKDCASEWFIQQRTMDLSRGDKEANLNELIKGGGMSGIDDGNDGIIMRPCSREELEKERNREYARKYREKNREKYNAYHRTYRAKQKGKEEGEK